MNEVLRVEQREATVELTLNRPRARNALSRELIARLTDEMRRAGIAPDVRSVIVTGAPPAFCAGLDLREVAHTTADEAEHDASALLTLLETIDQLHKPIIAAVNGPAVAGGAGLISVCDLVICGASAVVGYPEIKRGLVAAMVMTYLRRLVGERHAKYLLMTGESVSAERAVELGLATEVVPDDELMSRARHYAQRFTEMPPEALAKTKALLARLRHLQHADALEEARKLNASMRLTSESRAGVASFLNKS